MATFDSTPPAGGGHGTPDERHTPSTPDSAYPAGAGDTAYPVGSDGIAYPAGAGHTAYQAGADDAAALVPGLAAGAPAATPAARTPQEISSRRRKLLLLLGVVVPLIAALVVVSVWELRTGKPLSTLPGIGQDAPKYAFSIYGTSAPLGVAVTKSGDRIYVTESEGSRLVKVFDRSGKPLGSLRPPKSTGLTHVPVYVAVNPVNSQVYVSDRVTGAVYVYGRDGKFLRTFEPKGEAAKGWAPLGLAFDTRGRLYATDVAVRPHRVLAFDTDGSIRMTVGTGDSLSFPNGLAVDARGNIQVSDSNNGRVIVFDPKGRQIAAITRGVGEGDLGLPRGTTVDDSGRLYVVDTSNHTIRIYRVGTAKAPLPRYVTSFGDEGTVDGRFEYPNGVAADARARVYITDRENDRIQVWTY